MQTLKQIIPINKGMLAGSRTAKAVTLNKTKMSSLMPVLNWIAKDWRLNLSKTHDRTVAFRILKNSVIKN
jgi:hypothetical protein